MKLNWYNSGFGTSDYKKIPFRVVDSDMNVGQNGKIEFHLHTDIANDTNMAIVIKKALRDWSCATLIDWEIVGDTNVIAQSGIDGINLIYPAGDWGNTTTLALSTIAPYQCVSGEYIYPNESDIGIRTDWSNMPNQTGWFYDTSLTLPVPPGLHDFYHAIQHEFGHAHGLGHVNDTGSLMLSSVDAGYRELYTRKDLFQSSQQIIGGDFILTESGNLTVFCGQSVIRNLGLIDKI